MKEQKMREHMKERFGKVNNFCENPPLPKSLNIELNNTCNHKCSMCWFNKIERKRGVVMPIDLAKKILKEAHRLGMGERELGLYMSGEPFAYRGLVEIVAYAKSLGFKYTFLTSNGALATPDRMRALLDAGIDSLRFSVNAADRETYKEVHGVDDFDKVCENIKFASSYVKENNLDVAFSISCVLTKKTDGIQDKMKELFDEYVDDILFIPVFLSRDYFDSKYIEEHQLIDDSNATINEDYVCPVLFDSMYINASGHVLPCCMGEYHDLSCWDLNESLDFEAAWHSESFKKYRDIFLKKTDDTGTICATCMYRMKDLKRWGL